MGTSKSYAAKVKGQPQWGQLSGSVTRNCDGGVATTAALGNILSKYVSVIGGAGRAGRGRSAIAGRAGIKTARNLGAFLGSFASSGGNLAGTFQDVGLGDLSGLTLNDVINRLLEHCTGPSSTLDDVAAKAASEQLLEELAGESKTIEEWQQHLLGILNESSIEEIIERYFGYYIFEHLSVMFYEKLIVEKGKADCQNLFRQIKDYVFERVTNMNKTNPLNQIDWNSPDANRLVMNIQEDVLKIFEEYEG